MITQPQDPFRDPFAHQATTAGASNGRPRGRPGAPPGGLPGDPRGHVPGETGIWVFVCIDLLWFSMFLGVTVYTRGQHTAAFAEGRRSLALWQGTLNTLLLLTGSLFVAQAMRAVRRAGAERARRLIGYAMLCGLAFLVNKGVEWARLLHDHHHPNGASGFYTYFFILTGFHALHLIAGTAGLGYMRRLTRRPQIGRRELRNLEVVATYWHLVDFLWVAIFSVLYLMR